MRRAWFLPVGIVLSALGSWSGEASGGGGTTGVVTFTAPVPCAVVCPYWLGGLSTCIDQCEFPPFMWPCRDEQLLPGSYDDVPLTIPVDAIWLRFEIYPWVDWDSFICEVGDTWDGDGSPQEELAWGRTVLGEPCDTLLGPNQPISGAPGCREVAEMYVKPGRQVRLRVFNWSDPFPLQGRYVFTTR